MYNRHRPVVNNVNGLWQALLSRGYTDRNEEALPIIEKSLELNSNNANAVEAKGFILYNLCKFDEAIKCYDKALEINPNHIDALYHKGLCLDRIGKGEGCKRVLRQSKRIGVEQIPIH